MDTVSMVNCWIMVIFLVVGIGAIIMRARAEGKK
jgi:hypothetical protein